MIEQDTVRHVADLVQSCKSYLDAQSKDRDRAMEYYGGECPDLPVSVDADGVAVSSTVVSQDVRAIIKKVLPSITRTILGSDKVVEYEPVGPEDEEAAQQATDYVNYIVIPESNAEQAIYDAIHDALLLKTGILKWSAYTKRKAVIETYTDQSDEAVIGLFDEPDIEVIDHETSEETDPLVLQLDPNARRHSFKLKRISENTEIMLEGIPRGSFLITPGARSIEEAETVGEELVASRSSLVAMGYDKDKVWQIAEANTNEDGDEEARMGDDYTTEQAESRKALQEVLIYEVYVKIDSDDDGIAETHRIVYGDPGGQDDEKSKAQIVLGHEIVTEAPYEAVVIERDPYQFEGHSVFEDIEAVQKVKTQLLRETLNNLYRQNTPQMSVKWDLIENADAVMSGSGEPIAIKRGNTIQDAIDWNLTPFVADKSYQMLAYMDEVAKDRTGITDASGGLDPTMMQNVNNGVAAMASESGLVQADAIVRSIARGGLRKAFRGLLRLVVAHADQPRTVKLRGEWQEYDPRTWNVDMDCTVNVGLGGGTKERDMAMLQIVHSLQEKLLVAFGPDNPFVKYDQVYNVLQKMTEVAGFPSAEPYFTQPNPQEIQARLQAAQNKPDPEQMKLQAQMKLEEAKMATNRDKERAQMEADLAVKTAEIQAKTQENREKLALQREQDAQAERLAMEQMQQDYTLKMADINAKLAIAGANNAAKAQAPRDA